MRGFQKPFTERASLRCRHFDVDRHIDLSTFKMKVTDTDLAHLCRWFHAGCFKVYDADCCHAYISCSIRRSVGNSIGYDAKTPSYSAIFLAIRCSKAPDASMMALAILSSG